MRQDHQVMTVEQYRQAVRKPRKYRNEPTVVDGIRFPSRKEARRYMDLKLMEKGGEIWDLRIHPRWDFVVNGVFVGSYTADFAYKARQSFAETVEDVKSAGTRRARDWALRRNLMRACHGIEVRET